MSLRRLVPVAVGVELAVGLTACGGTTRDSAASDQGPAAASGAADPNAALKQGVKMAFLPKQLNNPYSDIEVSGGKVHGRAEG